MWLGNGMQQRQLQQYEQVQQCQQCHHCGFQRGTVLRYFESDSVSFAILVDVGLQRYQQNMMYHVVFAKSQAANVSAFGPKLLNLLSTMTLLAHVGTKRAVGICTSLGHVRPSVGVSKASDGATGKFVPCEGSCNLMACQFNWQWS